MMTAQAAIETSALGSLIATHGWARSQRRIHYLFVVFFIVTGVLALLMSFQQPVMLAVGGALLVVGFVGIPFIPLMARRTSLAFYEHGLLYQRLSKTRLVRYDEITAVWRKVNHQTTRRGYIGTTRVYTVQLRDGTKLVFDKTFEDIMAVGHRLQHEALRPLVSRIRAAYAAGEELSFGPIGLSQRGLSKKNELLPWSDVERMSVEGVESGAIVITRKNGGWFNWKRIPVAQVANVNVFLTLANQHVRVNLVYSPHDRAEAL